MFDSLPITPEVILTIAALTVLAGSVFFRTRHLCALIAFCGVIFAFISLSNVLPVTGGNWTALLTMDNAGLFSRVLILLITAGGILLSIGYKDLEVENEGEYYFFLLVLAISLMLAVSAKNLMMVYITLEAVSLVSYILAGYAKRNPFSSEAGLKYFIFGAFSTGLMLYGISLIYGMTGTFDLGILTHQMDPAMVSVQPLYVFAVILLLVGVAFKCSLVPFHMWTPDVYQGAPTPVTALLSLGPKVMGFILILRLFVFNSPFSMASWTTFAGLIAMLTMTAGNFMALGQGNIKRLLAFSSIAHAGFILIGLSIGSPQGISATLFYLVIYVIMNLAAFGAVIMVSNHLKSDEIDDYAGLYRNHPKAAIFLAIALLSLAGIPPLAGFMAKLLIISSAVQAKMYLLAVIAVLNSAVALFYYLKVIKSMFLHEPRRVVALNQDDLSFEVLLIVVILANLVLGLSPNLIFKWLSCLLF